MASIYQALCTRTNTNLGRQEPIRRPFFSSPKHRLLRRAAQ